MKPAASRRSEPTDAVDHRAGPSDDLPLRLLLITDQAEWSWVMRMIAEVMAPVDVVQVNTLANALWRLGRERFDSVLLHLTTADRQAVEICRRHLADVAALPVLDLDEGVHEERLAGALDAAGRAEKPVESRPSRWPPRAGRHRTGRPRGPRRELPFASAR